MSENPTFTRQRRSLNIVSIALIIYFGAGGTMDNGMRISTFGITLEDELIAAVFVWAAYAYFLIRYFQHSAEARKVWCFDRMYEISQDPLYRRLFKTPSVYSHDLTPILKRKFLLRREANWSEAHNFSNGRAGIESTISHGDFTDAAWFPLPRRGYAWPAFKAYFRALLKYPGWSNYILPLLLAALALASAVFRVLPIWHTPQPPLIGI